MNDTNGIIYIDSRQSIKAYDKKADMVFNNRFSLQGVKKIALCSYDFTYDIDNINALNRTAYIETTSQTYPVRLTPGKYNYEDLAVVIKLSLQATGLGVFTVVYDKSVFIINSPVLFRFIQGPDPHSDWSDMIGMGKRESYALEHISISVVDISYTRAIYICSDSLHSYKDKADSLTNNRNNILEIVYVNKDANLGNSKDVDAPASNNAHHITDRIAELKWVNFMSGRDLQNIDIKLYDDDGYLLDGSKFDYILQILTM